MSSVSCSTRFVTAHLAQRGPQVAPRLNLTRYSKHKLRRSRRGPSAPGYVQFLGEEKRFYTAWVMTGLTRRPDRVRLLAGFYGDVCVGTIGRP